MFETSMTVPTTHLRELTRRLALAGFTVLDTGDRVTTDAGTDAEATLVLLHMGEEMESTPILGVAR